MTRRAVPALAGALGAAGAWWLVRHLRSPAVRTWSPSALAWSTAAANGGLIHYRSGGPDHGPNQLLVHGLVATGDVFGAAPDALARAGRVVVPDLLGFGRSLDESRTDFGTDAHLDAIDEVIAREFGDEPLRILAHSMGSALAVRWAAANPTRVERVVCLGAPIWADADTARAALGSTGTMGKLFALDSAAARRFCHFNCTHRDLAGMLSAVVAPRWPIPVARQASLHTWDAYVGALGAQILDVPWATLFDTLDANAVPVHLVWGSNDSVGDRAAAEAFLAGHALASIEVIDGADHTLPTARPDLVADAITGRARGTAASGRPGGGT